MKTEMNFNKTYHITPLNGGISTQNPSQLLNAQQIYQDIYENKINIKTENSTQ